MGGGNDGMEQVAPIPARLTTRSSYMMQTAAQILETGTIFSYTGSGSARVYWLSFRSYYPNTSGDCVFRGIDQSGEMDRSHVIPDIVVTSSNFSNRTLRQLEITTQIITGRGL